MIWIVVFTGFLTGCVGAVITNRWRMVRRGFVAVLLGTAAIPMVVGQGVWPFPAWALFAGVQETTDEFAELRVATARGEERRLDARAVHPLEPTPTQRLATDRFQQLTVGDQRAVASWILDEANEYRDTVVRGDVIAAVVGLPSHQTGTRWTRADLAELGPFTAVRVYRVRVELAPDARSVASTTDELVLQVTP